MPRRKYYERKKAAREATQPVVEQAAAPAGTTEALHLRCAVCGLMARTDRLEAGPYTTHARLQTYGGNKNLTWSDPRELEDGELRLLTSKTVSAAEQLGGQPSIELTTPEPHEPAEEPLPEDLAGAIAQGEGLGERISTIQDAVREGLQELMDEEKKAASIKKVERIIEGMDADRWEGVDEVQNAIGEYRDAEREEKADAFSEVTDALGEIRLKVEEE